MLREQSMPIFQRPSSLSRLIGKISRPSQFVVSMFILLSSPVIALDIVTVNVGESETDRRILFKNALIKQALEITKEEYGDYKIVENPLRMNISRAFRELELGENLSLTFAHTRPEFEQKALAIKVPIRRGVDSYRLLVVKTSNIDKYKDVSTLEQLKAFTVGLSPYWATYKIMESEGFKVKPSPNYDGMFNMLETDRFDFIPRALNEVYNELNDFTPSAEGLSIVPNIALYIPAKTYMFVSTKQPRIFQRLNSGLHAMNINGDLAELGKMYFKTFVDNAQIQKRTIISIDD